jgi:amino acid adenylation domain-containing protein
MNRAGAGPARPASRLSPAAQALLEERLKRRSAGDSPRQGIPRRSEPGPAPLSFAQERIWFLARLAPESPAYNIARSFALRGPLDRAALERSVREIVRRHEALRTTFAATGATLVQRIAAEPCVQMPTVELGGLPASLGEAESERLRHAEAERPFDLESGPLVRTVLLRSGPGERTLLLTIHHIVADGWSMDLLFRELSALYAGASLPEPPLQYADFVVWQRGRLQGDNLERLLAYWQGRLGGAPPMLELPSDRPRPRVRTWAGGLRTFGIPVPAAAVRAAGAAQGASPFMVLLAAFFALLQRATGRTDLVAGSPVAGRDRSELEGLIGLFVNTLVLRADLAGDPSFEEVLRRAREATLGAYNHQEMPFDKLVEVLAPERDLSSTPLIQVLFALEDMGRSGLGLPGLAVTPLPVWSGTAKFDLSFTLAQEGEGFAATLIYDREIFDAATMSRLAGHFGNLLAGAAAGPGRRLSDLPLLTEGESQQLLREWNDTGTPYPEAPCLHELVAAQAARSPERVAVAFEGESLTYAELEAAAGRLAQHLAGLGAGPEVPVAICAERSLELVVGLLAILKSGSAYLPLDPSYPADRLAYMLEDSRAPVLLVHERLLERLPDPGAAVLLLDGMAAAGTCTASSSPSSPGALPGSPNLAYVIYTSGSTGRPKGTMNAHRGIVNRLLWMQERFRLTADDAVLQKTPFSFDVSVWEFFWPLLAGARLVMARPGGHQDPSYLVDTIAAQGITTLHFVPSMLQAFLEAPGVERCTSLERVVCSGEALPAELERRFYARMPAGAGLYNLYGPTEAAVDVTHWTCERESRRAAVPIGVPVANTRIHLLDPSFRPVPVGVSGELYIGGVQVGRGYLGRPGLTAEKLVPDPFEPSDPGGRLYRSGDLARHLPAGEIEFLGRMDHQVKIRGFRIELQEIEAALAALPAVREAVVVALDGGSLLDHRLVAYVAASGGEDLSPAVLRESLKESLPDSMVPAAFVVLPSLPLSPNGKVDRRALPAPEAAVFAGAAGERPFTAPRTELERLLAGLWKEYLRRAAPVEVGVQDDFFALGGNSLGAALLVNRLQERLGGSVPVAALFEASTVERMARYLSERHAGAMAADTILPVALPPGAPVPLSYAQERLWFLAWFEPESPFYNIPAPLRLSGRLDVPALAWSLWEIRRRHSVLRAVFSVTAEGTVQRIGELPPAALPVLDLSGLGPARRAEAGRLAAEEARRPFDLESGPPLRATLLKLAADDHLLLLTFHHIVTDGWSMGVLAQELSALYTAAIAVLRGEAPSPLAELPIQYADFARWQRERLSGDLLEEQLAYWRRQLSGAPALLELPTDRPRPPVMRFRGGRVPAGAGPRLTAALAALGRKRGTTLFMALAAGFAALLSRTSGFFDIPLGTILSGRTRPECENLIGVFVNTLVLRVDLEGDPGFGTVLGRVRRVAVEAYTHQDAPFERLVQELRPERSLAHSPLFQAMVMLADGPGQQVELPGLTIAFEQPESGTAKFDLNLGLTEETGRLTGSLAFNSDLFDATTAARLAHHLETLLEGAVADPDRRLSELALLTGAERHQALLEWNDTASGLLDGPCLHDLFLARAERAPDAPAAIFEGRTLSYGELARRAGRLARRLSSLGVRPGVLVAIHLERGPEMVVALLGILQAGGAYVPLSSSFPEERIRVILETMEIGHLVTEDPRPGGITLDVPATVLLPFREELMEEVTSPGPEDLAYVIFTSGSTGAPKGVMVRHRPAVQLVDWVNRTFGIGPSDRVLFVTDLSFDLSVYDVFGLLAAGGSLRIASAGEVRDPASLVRILEEEPVTFWDSAPAALQQLVPFLPAAPSLSARLRLVFLSGDWIPVALPDRIRQAFPGARVVSLGGATEATVWSNYHPVAEVLPHWTSIPYGRPIANALYHVLDPGLGLCPIGVPGDLYIGGECVSTGYARDPVLTAGKYIPSPFGPSPIGDEPPGARLYRTGDRARHWGDGTLEFLGRSDNQVKIRGFRIELGEIEAALAGHPGVREAVVLVRDQRLVACVVPDQRPAPMLTELRRFLKTRLPDYMLPSDLVVREAWPVTSTGKLDRRALLEDAQAPGPAVEAPPRTALERAIAAIWAEVIGRREVDVQENFFDLGGHSLLLAEVQVRLRETLGRDVTMVDLFRYPTVASLAELLEGTGPAPQETPAPSRGMGGSSIAIVGMAGRFPGACDLEELWSNLCGGVESITFFSREELAAAGVDPELLADPSYVRARGVLSGADLFDAAFFDCPPREAEILDPQQRVFLECSWEALEGAGYVPERVPGRVGVYAGLSDNTYAQGLYADPGLVRSMGLYQLSLANKADYLPTRVSYKLGLRGPSVNVQTACSTSLTAVHMACRALLDGECEMALAGGVSIRCPQVAGYRYEEGSIASPDGHVRAFDAGARGTVGGNGAGVVLLKRLEDAVADGDTIRAVILGSAINNDGSSKVGFTAPSVEGQADVIRQAHRAAGVDAETIRYVEAHGTGTAMGDPIEVAALTEAFRGSTPKRGFCALGTLKTNVGHLDAAAGIAGLLKTALCLERRTLPPSLNFTAPNPGIDFAGSPFFVNAALADWPQGPRRAGVSSFGIGGTNAHAVLEEAPACEPGATSRPVHLLLLSARTPEALDAATARLANHLERHPETGLADAAYTLQVGRRTFRHRRMLVCTSRDLRSAEAVTREHAGGPVPVAFLLPGQGAQRDGMGEELQEAEPAFREGMDRAKEVLGPGLREVQPALFAVEHALAQVLMEWGIRPQAMLGHSLGEYVAACLAGVFSFEDGLRLVAARGRLMAELPPGGMVGLALPEEEARTLLPGLSLAAVNGPTACTLSGPPEAVAELCGLLERRGVEHRLLRTSHAFHSPAMEPVAGRFADELRRIGLEPPRIPFLSNVTGTWITAAEATDPEYWVRQMLCPVRFAEGAAALLAEDRSLLEVGPGRTLSVLAGQQPGARGRVVASSAEPAGLMKAVGRLWLSGAEVDWAAFHGRERRRRVPLPTYPFERRPYWHGHDVPAVPAAAPEPVRVPVRKAGTTAGSALEQGVAAVFEELLGVSGVVPGDDFFDLGGSSLMAVQLCARLRQTLGAELPSSVLLEDSTVAALAARIAGSGVPPRPSCRVRLREGGDRRPLFLVHQVGGHVFSFRALARALPPGRPLYGLRSLGLEDGEEPLACVGDMADLYIDLVREVQPRGPYLLGGASMGGLVALEMAQRLRAAGEDVPLLTLMDVPCRDVLPGPPTEEELLAQVSPASDPGEAGRLLRVLRANVGALFAYEPRAYEGPALFFRARERRPHDPPRPELPWIDLAAGGIEIHVVPGDHATMHEPPHVQAMAARLAGRLASL